MTKKKTQAPADQPAFAAPKPTAGGTLPQVAYRWDDISVLAGLPA